MSNFAIAEDGWVYRITPIYPVGIGLTSRRGNPETIVDQLFLGRKQLGLLWWGGCCCRAHLPETGAVCKHICRPLRRNVKHLSRKLILLENSKVMVHPDCKYPELVHILPCPQESLSSQDSIAVVSYNVRVGHGPQEIWMNFQIDAVPTRIEGSAKRSTAGVDREPAISINEGCQSKNQVTPFATPINTKKRKTTTNAVSRSPKRRLFTDDAALRSEQPCLRSMAMPDTQDHVIVSSSSSAQLVTPSRMSQESLVEKTAAVTSCKRRLWKVGKPKEVESQADSLSFRCDDSYLSLPMPGTQDDEDPSSMSMQEETQYPELSIVKPSPHPKRCKDMTLDDWRRLQAPSNQPTRSFRETMIDLIVRRNEGKESNGQPIWLPDIIANSVVDTSVATKDHDAAS